MTNKKQIAKNTRGYRKIHRYVGSWLLLLLLVVSVSGLLLGWKKHSGGLILPQTEQGTTSNLKYWLSYDSLQTLAIHAFNNSSPEGLSPVIDRIDARPDKGIVKFIFKNHYTEIQLDGATGKMLALNTRKSDIIEQIHDGSILDFIIGTSSGQMKLIYTTSVALGLISLIVSGFWLWYNPRRIRKTK